MADLYATIAPAARATRAAGRGVVVEPGAAGATVPCTAVGHR